MNKSKFVVRDIVEIAMLVAIAVVLDLDFLKFTVFPAGGSVGLTMVPLFILAFTLRSAEQLTPIPTGHEAP